MNPNGITREEVQRILAAQQRAARPESWEEDISRNTLDERPFENLPPVLNVTDEELTVTHRFNTLAATYGADSLREMVRRDRFPIPSVEDREGYSAGFDLDYWFSGLEDLLKVQRIVDQFSIRPRSVFDFGCASGRFLRHWVAQTEVPEIWGSDINARHIRWLFEHLPDRVKPVFNHCIPALPMRDNSIDVITAFSVFTHIDTFETCWLAELSRIMRDDGMAYITVHDESTWEMLRDQVDNSDNRLIQSILKIDPTVAESIQQPLREGRSVYRFSKQGPYRAQVFLSRNYLQNVWGRFFQIEQILPGHHQRQTVLVLRKRP